MQPINSTTNILHRPLSVVVTQSGNAQPRQVLVTPLPGGPPTKTGDAPTVEKVMLKAVSKAGKESKLFTLRGLDTGKLISRDDIKHAILDQLQDDVSGDFDVGLIVQGNVIAIRSIHDLKEFWLDVKSGKKVMLWCNGLKEANKRKQSESSDSEIPSAKKLKKKRLSSEEREEHVMDTIEELKEKHGSSYTPMQFRIWSEMMVGGIHSSLDEPPSSTMFLRAGKVTSSKKKEDSSSVADALTKAAVAISSALAPSSSSSPGRKQGSASSPARVIESRSKCYKQLHDLNSLKVSGVLTEEEYTSEKEAVLTVLHKLNT